MSRSDELSRYPLPKPPAGTPGECVEEERRKRGLPPLLREITPEPTHGDKATTASGGGQDDAPSAPTP